jgi:hypothetical protein
MFRAEKIDGPDGLANKGFAALDADGDAETGPGSAH